LLDRPKPTAGCSANGIIIIIIIIIITDNAYCGVEGSRERAASAVTVN
jgi:hypothetical protein